MNKDRQIMIRVTEAERATLEKAALKEGRKLANFVCHWSLQKAKEVLGGK